LRPRIGAKEGGRFDLPIALGILLASRQLREVGADGPNGAPARECYGELLPMRGLTLAAAHAARVGHEIIVPAFNVRDARIVTAARAHARRDLAGARAGAGPLLDRIDLFVDVCRRRTLPACAAGLRQRSPLRRPRPRRPKRAGGRSVVVAV
jgi:predicted ATPase with chaperone activity